MVELGTWANVAEIVGGVSVVLGLVYAVWEVRRYREEKRRESGMALWQDIGTSDVWNRALRRVWRLPEDADPDVIEEDPDRGAAVNLVASTLNIHGFLVYEGVVPRGMSARAQVGIHLGIWRRIRRWVADVEATSGNPRAFVWLRWWIRELSEMEPLETPDPEDLQAPLGGPPAAEDAASAPV